MQVGFKVKHIIHSVGFVVTSPNPSSVYACTWLSTDPHHSKTGRQLLTLFRLLCDKSIMPQ